MRETYVCECWSVLVLDDWDSSNTIAVASALIAVVSTLIAWLAGRYAMNQAETHRRQALIESDTDAFERFSQRVNETYGALLEHEKLAHATVKAEKFSELKRVGADTPALPVGKAPLRPGPLFEEAVELLSKLDEFRVHLLYLIGTLDPRINLGDEQSTAWQSYQGHKKKMCEAMDSFSRAILSRRGTTR